MNYIDSFTNVYPTTEQDIRNQNPNMSFGTPFIPPPRYMFVFSVPVPEYDPNTQKVVEGYPIFTQKRVWEQNWQIVELPDV